MFTKWQALTGQSRIIETHRPESPSAMGLFKPDFYRMFAIGFAVGALFVASTTDLSVGEKIANGVIPVAEAQAAR
jgi:hypothetical protein